MGLTLTELKKKYGEPVRILEKYDESKQFYYKNYSFNFKKVLPTQAAWLKNNIEIFAYFSQDHICRYITFGFENEHFQFYLPENTDIVNKIVLDLLDKNSNGFEWSCESISGRSADDKRRDIEWVRKEGDNTKVVNFAFFGVYKWARSDGGGAKFQRGGAFNEVSQLELWGKDFIKHCLILEKERLEQEEQKRQTNFNSTDDL